MRWLLFFLFFSSSVFAGNATIYPGVYINTSAPRDANIIGMPATNWGSISASPGYDCGGVAWNYCNDKFYLKPMNSTGNDYIDSETGNTYTIYKTTDPAIGVVYEIKDLSQNYFTPARGVDEILFYAGNATKIYTSKARARLIYIGNFSTGNYFHMFSPSAIGVVRTNAGVAGTLSIMANSFTVSPLTCTVSAASGSKINLGDINESSLPEVGSAGDKVPFSINLSCPANVTVKGYLVDILHPSNTGNKLLINETIPGAAEGVAVNIYSARILDKALPFGYDSSVAGGVNELPILPAVWKAYEETINLSAQLVRTGELKAGKVNAMLGITFSYQ